MLIDKIKSDLVVAMKNRDEVRKLVLRSLLSAINYYKIELQRSLTDTDIQTVVGREVKKHRESIEMYKKGERTDLVEKEQKELDILLTYLPEQMDAADVEKIVKQEIEKLKASIAVLNPGIVMKTVMTVLKGKAEGKVVKEIVDKMLS